MSSGSPSHASSLNLSNCLQLSVRHPVLIHEHSELDQLGSTVRQKRCRLTCASKTWWWIPRVWEKERLIQNETAAAANPLPTIKPLAPLKRQAYGANPVGKTESLAMLLLHVYISSSPLSCTRPASALALSPSSPTGASKNISSRLQIFSLTEETYTQGHMSSSS